MLSPRKKSQESPVATLSFANRRSWSDADDHSSITCTVHQVKSIESFDVTVEETELSNNAGVSQQIDCTSEETTSENTRNKNAVKLLEIEKVESSKNLKHDSTLQPSPTLSNTATHPNISLYSSDKNPYNITKNHTNGDPFVATMSSILPSLCQLDEESQASILNMILEELTFKNEETFSDEVVEDRERHDFDFAQKQRRMKYEGTYSWGVLGLYEYLNGVSLDLSWANDAVKRREKWESYMPWSYFDLKFQRKMRPPFFTCILLCVHTGTLIASFALNNWNVEGFHVNPMLGPNADVLVDMGAKEANLMVNGKEWYRLFSAAFLNAGVIQFAINLVILAFVSNAMERYHGMLVVFVLYLFPAIGGTIISAILLPEYVTVSANGGVCGMVGACLADIVMNSSFLFNENLKKTDKPRYNQHVRVVIGLSFALILNVLFGLAPFIDNFTNLGGFGYGFLCGLSSTEQLSTSVSRPAPEQFRSKIWHYFKRYFGLVVSLGLIMTSSALLDNLIDTKGVTTSCRNCHYLGCVSLPPWKPDNEKWWYCDDCDAYTIAYPSMNETLNIFSEIKVVCPNEQEKTINIEEEQISDRDVLESQIPSYCREHCESRFANYTLEN